MIDRNDFEYRLAEHKRRIAASDHDPRHLFGAPPTSTFRVTLTAKLRALVGLGAASAPPPGPIASTDREEATDSSPRERLSPWG